MIFGTMELLEATAGLGSGVILGKLLPKAVEYTADLLNRSEKLCQASLIFETQKKVPDDFLHHEAQTILNHLQTVKVPDAEDCWNRADPIMQNLGYSYSQNSESERSYTKGDIVAKIVFGK